MAEQRQWYLISYDVRDEKRLRLVARQLEGYGSRVQLSVFRCRLNMRGLERLKWELTKIMDPEDDLLIIGLCTKCADRIRRRNVVESWLEEISTYEVV
jgi:CRISPR-associated protein Cas2